MSIRDLVLDPRTSIDDEVASLVDDKSYGAMLRHLQKYGFWQGPKPALYEHQRRAVETVAAYISADPHLPERPHLREAALLKLPTGSGKSGIVAVLGRCLPKVMCTICRGASDGAAFAKRLWIRWSATSASTKASLRRSC
jgi:hypothetical protein